MPDILIGPIITDCKASSDRCTNCKRFDPQKNFCKLRQTAIESPASTTCKHWRDQADDKLTCSLNPDPHGSCWECPIDCQRWKDMKREAIGAAVMNPNGITKMQLGDDKKPASGKVTMKDIEDKLAQVRKERIQTIALDRGIQQGHMLEMLDTVFDIACQQVPSCRQRWTALKDQLQTMLFNKWAKENEDQLRA